MIKFRKGTIAEEILLLVPFYFPGFQRAVFSCTSTKPSFATVGIFSFLWSYNDLFTQQFFLRNKDEWAITRLLLEISSKEGTNYGLMAAVVTLVVVPLLIVYVCLQKYIVKGMTAGAVKG